MTRIQQHGGSTLMDDDAPVIIDRPPTEIMSPATRAEVDIQISTAKRFPRNVASFKDQALTMATLDEDTASGCFYSMPRGGKPIEGPSVRLAEIVLSSWGNLRADARVIDVGQRDITAEGMAWDLEKNIAIRVQVKRRITDKNNNRYSDDMIVVTGNAACSIALRNAVFKVIPMAFTRDIYLAARKVAIGDAQTLASKRAAMFEYFGKMGIVPDRVCLAVGKPSVEDISLDDLGTLKGMATAIREGDTTVDEAFPIPVDPNKAPAGNKAEELAAKIAGIAAAKKGEPAPQTQPEEPKAKRGRPAKRAAPTKPTFDADGNPIEADIDAAMSKAAPNQTE